MADDKDARAGLYIMHPVCIAYYGIFFELHDQAHIQGRGRSEGRRRG